MNSVIENWVEEDMLKVFFVLNTITTIYYYNYYTSSLSNTFFTEDMWQIKYLFKLAYNLKNIIGYTKRNIGMDSTVCEC